MSNFRARRLLPVVAVLGSIAAVPAAAQAQANCDWYAKTALRQQQENEQRKCGFKGPEWNSDLRAHISWCSTASPDQWKFQAQRREQMLANCKK